jgi:transposase
MNRWALECGRFCKEAHLALGKRKDVAQPLFLVAADLPGMRPHPYYDSLNKVLAAHEFDAFVEGLCAKFYAPTMGRPGLPPGVYFRCLMVGYLEGLDSERGIAWRVADSNSLRLFLGYAIDQSPPDHSTLSRTRRLIDVETHAEVFRFILKVLANHDLLGGKTLGIDSTTLEANAAMRSIVRRDTNEGYSEFLQRLAKESGIETPTREDLARLDKNRKNKASNDDWKNPHDPDAKIAKMKDGTTHLAHKAEHAVDMGEGTYGAIVAVNVCDASVGDTNTLLDTIVQATENLQAVADDERVAEKIDAEIVREVAGDKGYHSKQTMRDLNEISIRSFMSEPDRGRQKWGEDIETRNLIYDNRRRIRGDRGKRLLRRRGELVERSFAHCYETGGMRRLHLRGRENITKRVLIHAAGFNLGLLMRVSYGLKKPRGLTARACALILWLWTRCIALIRSMRDRLSDLGALLMTNRAHAPRLAA